MLLAADVDGGRLLAHPNSIAYCPFCGMEMIPKCGVIKIWHWAHKQSCPNCEYVSETEWHINLKKIALDSGCDIEVRLGKNIADVFVPKQNRVVELQNSSITGDEIITCTQNLIECIILNLPPSKINKNYVRPTVDWIFNLSEKNERVIVDRFGIETPYIEIQQNDHNPKIFNIRERWRKRIIELLFNDRGYPRFGNIFLDLGDPNFFRYIRLFPASGRGYGMFVNPLKILR